MSFTFDATAKGASANSYVTETEFADYLGGRMDVAEYTAAATVTIQAALAMATVRLEAERWKGQPTTSTQRLQWPRYGVAHQHWVDSGYTVPYYGCPTYDQDTVPQPIKEACFELALAALKNPATLADSGLEGFDDVTVGPLKVTPNHDFRAGTLPAHVQRLLKGLRSATSGSIPVGR
jgi:hypothetical protein